MSSYLDEIWASVPADRHIDEAAIDWTVETLARAGEHARVLDLGCGDGRVAGRLARVGFQVTGTDPSRVALERARAAYPELAFVAPAADGSLPFGDGSFDAVACLHVLEHVADTQRLMSEARRVLVPGGRISITVPNHGRIRRTWIALVSFERHFDPLEPTLRFYTQRSLRELLARFGYGDFELDAVDGPPFFRRTLLARARR